MSNTTGYREYHIKLYQNQKAEDLSVAIRDACGKISGANVNRVKLGETGDTEAKLLSLVNQVKNIIDGGSESKLEDIEQVCNGTLAGL